MPRSSLLLCIVALSAAVATAAAAETTAAKQPDVSRVAASQCDAGYKDTDGVHKVSCPLKAEQPVGSRCVCHPVDQPHISERVGHAIK